MHQTAAPCRYAEQGPPVDAYLIRSLLPSIAKVRLNVEGGDHGTIEVGVERAGAAGERLVRLYSASSAHLNNLPYHGPGLPVGDRQNREGGVNPPRSRHCQRGAERPGVPLSWSGMGRRREATSRESGDLPGHSGRRFSR